MQNSSSSRQTTQRYAVEWDPENLRLAELLEQARQGSRTAFEALYDRTAPGLLAEVRRLVRDDQAEDVLAETFLQAWRTLAYYDRGRALPGVWLGMIASSRALDHLLRAGLAAGLPHGAPVRGRDA